MLEVFEGWWWVKKVKERAARRARRLRAAHGSSALLGAEGPYLSKMSDGTNMGDQIHEMDEM